MLMEKYNRTFFIRQYLDLMSETNLVPEEKEQMRQVILNCLYFIEVDSQSTLSDEYTVEYYYANLIPIRYKIMKYSSGEFDLTISNLLNV